jgi:hypothetical protein
VDLLARNPDGTPAPPIPAPTGPPQQLSTLARLRLAEPVRLYAYGMQLLLVVVLTAAAAITGRWDAYAWAAPAVVVALVVTAELVRPSVFSLSAMASLLLEHRGRILTVPTPEKDH